MNAKVTIFIPTHNRRVLLERAIQSVVRQTYDNLEIIVVNDASTDDTRAYLDGLRASEPRLTVIHFDRSMGAPAARNRAINLAQGQFITGLDDDDEFTPTRIASLMDHWIALGGDAGAISGLFTPLVMTDGNFRQTINQKAQVEYEDLFYQNFIGNQIFCPTRYLKEIGGFDEGMPAWQDLELFMRLLKAYGPARLVPDHSYIYYVDNGRDRISRSAPKRYAAFERIAQKNQEGSLDLQPYLFMQLFAASYGTVPRLSDLGRMVRWRADPRLLARMLRATLRNGVVALLHSARSLAR